jgi:hypothetical protein
MKKIKSLSYLEIIKITSNRLYTSSELKKHEDDYFCNRWWCHKVIFEIIPISKIKSNIKNINLHPSHSMIEYDILNNGYDYSKGFIKINSEYKIIDGHHRYFILKTHFKDDFKIKVLKMVNVKNIFPIFFLKMIFNYYLSKIVSYFIFPNRKGKLIKN